MTTIKLSPALAKKSRDVFAEQNRIAHELLDLERKRFNLLLQDQDNQAQAESLYEEIRAEIGQPDAEFTIYSEEGSIVVQG